MSSKKNKKNTKHKNIKKNTQQELDPKVEKLLNKAMENQKIRKDKKIWFWLILVPPIGVYKSFKYKAFSKFVNIFLLILISVVLLLGLDTIFYPNRVLDTKIIKSIERYEDIGEVRSYIKQGDLDDKFFIYNVVTTTGEYDVYFSGDGKFTIEGINQISPENKMIYKSDNIPNELNNIYAEIIRFFNEEDVVEKYGNITGYKDGDMENHQIIITDKGEYSIEVEYGQVVAVFELNENGDYKKLMQRNAEIKLPDDISKTLERNKKTIGEVKEVYGYKITDKTIEYLFMNDKNTHYKIVKYLDGSMEILIANYTSTDDDKNSNE